MTFEEIKQAVEKAASENRALKINGYVSSTGAVYDYVVKLLAPGGYHLMVKAAAALATSFQRPDWADAETWCQALQEQLASWNKSLSGDTTAPKWGDQYVKSGAAAITSEKEPETIWLRDLVAVTVNEIVAPEKTTNSSLKTRCKKEIVRQSPLDYYVGSLKLSPTKLDTIEVI